MKKFSSKDWRKVKDYLISSQATVNFPKDDKYLYFFD